MFSRDLDTSLCQCSREHHSKWRYFLLSKYIGKDCFPIVIFTHVSKSKVDPYWICKGGSRLTRIRKSREVSYLNDGVDWCVCNIEIILHQRLLGNLWLIVILKDFYPCYCYCYLLIQTSLYLTSTDTVTMLVLALAAFVCR